jgi:hypothetical protein
MCQNSDFQGLGVVYSVGNCLFSRPSVQALLPGQQCLTRAEHSMTDQPVTDLHAVHQKRIAVQFSGLLLTVSDCQPAQHALA